LHELRTLPSQVLRFQSLSLGPAKILDGRLQVQLDGLTSGLTERLDFAFSGGRVTTTAFQFPAQDTGMEIDFICDRLQLADMLNMITGKSNATGQGTISGVLPVRIGSDGIHFKEAHLATSPGDTGILRVEDAADMTGGILLAEESIRDFSYEWAKVNIENSRDHLNMVVQLSGKPRRKLPLKFDPAKRDFVRDPSGERLVDLKGLLLELKFVDIDINALLREAGLR
ncbi:MAG: YdbH domain-containing protein, partial [Candidatus Aminicenantes bacterium]|nr:YdbH domain-containing protein [Candidatus Aminicenantes bacterium]